MGLGDSFDIDETVCAGHESRCREMGNMGKEHGYIDDAANELKDYTDYCRMLLFYTDIIVFKTKSAGIEVYFIMASGWSCYGDFYYIPRFAEDLSKTFRHCKSNERALCLMHRVYYYHTHGIDFDCFQADNENKDINTGKCHAGKKT